MTDCSHAHQFHELHREGTFVLPNAWDAASAAVIAAAGAPAIGTTSSGISWAYGIPDGDNLGRERALAAVARIAGAAHVPVSADIETGYGASPAEVPDTVHAVIRAGAVGANIEDRRWHEPGPLRAVGEQCERLAAARGAAPRQFVINARCDVYLAGVGSSPSEREELVLERADGYARAGADCLFVPGLTGLAAIERIVSRSPIPVNVLLVPGRGPTLHELRAAGVRRVSCGHWFAAAAYGATRDAVAALLQGDDASLRGAPAQAEMHALLSAA